MKFAEEIVTPAIEAMAKQVWEDSQQNVPEIARSSWEHGHPVTKQQIKQGLLPLLMAALEAIPDPRFAPWEQGYVAGRSDQAYAAGGMVLGDYQYHTNPYQEA